MTVARLMPNDPIAQMIDFSRTSIQEVSNETCRKSRLSTTVGVHLSGVKPVNRVVLGEPGWSMYLAKTMFSS